MTRDTRDILMNMYRAMLAHFGPQNWWPAREGKHDGALEICIGAILTQNTNWNNVEKALANLFEMENLNVESLANTPLDELAQRIRPAGYYNVKARRLRAFVGHVISHHDADLSAMLAQDVTPLRSELLSINGIGPETADRMILSAAEKPSFVVDAYTFRVLRRHKLISENDKYDDVKRLFEQSTPRDVSLWNDYHAQLVAVGKWFCKPTARCDRCPLKSLVL